MREAVIVAGARTAVGKAHKGTLKNTRPEELGAAVVGELMRRVPQVDPKEVEDVIMGCAMPEGEQGLNIARIIAVRAGLPTEVPGVTVNRFCSSGLQTIAMAAEKIMCGFADVVIAGGVESMSMVPMAGYKPSPNPYLMEHYPQIYMSMGHTAEEVAKRFGVSREDQDRFAVESHRKAHGRSRRANSKMRSFRSLSRSGTSTKTANCRRRRSSSTPTKGSVPIPPWKPWPN